ncbi:MAG: hypothetical protein WKG52_11585 [Variovorax sp.]
MKCLVVVIWVVWFGLCGQPARAEVEYAQGIARVRGNLKTVDAVKLDEILANNYIEKIIFGDSLGGTAEAAFNFMEVIKRYKAKTEVDGKCFSACALAFIAGSERRFHKGRQINLLMFHMGRTQKNKLIQEYDENERLFRLLDEATDGRLKEPVRSLIRKAWTPEAGVLFTSAPSFFGRKYQTFYCNGEQKVDFNKCQFIENSNALELGIVTGLD